MFIEIPLNIFSLSSPVYTLDVPKFKSVQGITVSFLDDEPKLLIPNYHVQYSDQW